MLPDPLLLAVLQCVAADGGPGLSSLFSAARAHSRLHQAAVLALNSIAVEDPKTQQQMENILLYLSKHGQHVSSISLGSDVTRNITVRLLPSTNLQLDSLQLSDLHLQLLPAGSSCDNGQPKGGVLGYDCVSSLKQLRLSSCVLLDGDDYGEEGLSAALSLLPDLEHLSLTNVWLGRDDLQHTHMDGHYYNNAARASFCISVLQQQMTQLTHFELRGVSLQEKSDQQHGDITLQPTQHPCRL